MTQSIIQALKLSFVADSQTLKLATQKLTQFKTTPGYCMKLMEIADCREFDIPVKQAALVQLKQTIQKHWESKTYQIPEEEKQGIMVNLMVAFIRCCYSFALIKIYREIVGLVVDRQYKRWLPVQEIVGKLNNNEDVVPLLHFIQAISTNFEFGSFEEVRVIYYEFLKVIFPCLYSLFQRNQEAEIIYLITKIIWKAVHYEISDQVRNIICNWMELILTVAGASNQEFQGRIEETQDKGTAEFFYFHAKKWATRILYRFIFRHAKPNVAPLASEEVKRINKEFSKYWYDTFGKKVIEVVINQFSIPCTKKIRFFQLKCISGLVQEQPEVMKSYAQHFQYEILPRYLMLTPEDEELANSDVVEFICQQTDTTIGYTNLKRAATEAWTKFAEIGMKSKSKIGTVFFDNMKYLKLKLQSNNILQKQMAMYLLCQLRFSIIGCKEVTEIIPEMVSEHVLSEFSSQITFLKARSVEIFSQYSSLPYAQNVVKKAVEGIYICLTSDPKPLVRIKAAQAFHCMLKHRGVKDLVEPFLKGILQVYVELVEKYDLQILVHGLESIVDNFCLEIGPYAYELVKYLSKHFVKLYHKDNQLSKEKDYDGQTELAAAGALSAIKRIVESPVQRDKIMLMQTQILDIIDLVFASDDTDYIEDGLSVLKAYTHKVTSISEKLLFYYSICIYYVNGIKEEFWANIEGLAIPDINKKALWNLKSGCNIEALDSVMPVLRNYISGCSNLLFQCNDPFGINLLTLTFSMISHIYEKGPDHYEGEIEMNGCTITLVYLVENNYQQLNNNLMTDIWQVAKHNFQKAKSKTLNTLNIQLACVMLWSSPVITVFNAQKDSLFQNLLKMCINCEPLLKEEHERQRVILGLCTFLGMKEKPNEIFHLLPQIFKLLVNLVKKNAELRTDEDHDENYVTDSEDDEEDILQKENLPFNLNEHEDIWDEDYGNNYTDKLDDIDDIKYFRECMQYMQKEEESLYKSLVGTIPESELLALDEKMTKAIQMLEEQVDRKEND